ncbi:hypothetical protein BH582_23870 [Vibrio sp. 10N.222.47.A9]|uniref:hypothetical protein n=1 Tax=Vibrio sp. 10N.222.47.A9 TaxID=1903178 RepID=UPI000976EB33|nr:hypothetical protein [Vibrio sp. 10N.222.47.A9]OMO23505.1 hypothetical protein BH582_23870 [Vibrio sp. 10N.222.47.A9]
MSRFNIFLLLLIPIVALANPDENLPIGTFELNIGARPSVPYPAMDNYNTDLTEQGFGPEYPVTVSRHHIIPFNVLRSFYNRLAELNRFSNIGGFFTTYSDNLRFYASGNNVDCGNLGNDIVDAGNLALAHRYAFARPGGYVMAQGFDTFEQFYVWLPGNLFIGPNERSDDPGEGFESNANVVVGEAYFHILRRTYQNMVRFNNGDDSPTLLNAISVDLTRIAQRRSISPLNSQDWVYVHGKYQLRDDGIINKVDNIKDLRETKKLSDDKCSDMLPNLIQNIILILDDK